jgi:hypothetical protein
MNSEVQHLHVHPHARRILLAKLPQVPHALSPRPPHRHIPRNSDRRPRSMPAFHPLLASDPRPRHALQERVRIHVDNGNLQRHHEHHFIPVPSARDPDLSSLEKKVSLSTPSIPRVVSDIWK